MIQTQTQHCPIGCPTVNSNTFSLERSILDLPRASVVEIALQALQGAGVELVEWDALLYIRMKVPRKRRVSHLFESPSYFKFA